MKPLSESDPSADPPVSQGDDRETAEKRRQQQSRQRRLERYQEVVALRAKSQPARRSVFRSKPCRDRSGPDSFQSARPLSADISHVREFEQYLRPRLGARMSQLQPAFREIRLQGYRLYQQKHIVDDLDDLIRAGQKADA